jgi:hypothetical protein
MNYNDFTKSGLSSLQRPKFNAGQLLEDDDLNAGVIYTQQLMSILMRSLFGCGVICGLDLEAKVDCKKLVITVHGGLALDCLGNPIQLEKTDTITLDPGCDPLPPVVWVAICSTEKCCRPKEADCSSDDAGQAQYTRIRYGYDIKVYDKIPTCACHCGPDDTPPGTQAKSDCCNDNSQTAAQQLPSTDQNPAEATAVFPCPCFQSHFTGHCDCGCNCKCVVLGKVTPPDPVAKDQSVWVADAGAVRKIRPVLNGYFGCTAPPQVKSLGDDPKEGEPNLQALLGDVLYTRAAELRKHKKKAAAEDASNSADTGDETTKAAGQGKPSDTGKKAKK